MLALAIGLPVRAHAQTGATLESFRPARSPADAFGVNGGDPGKHLELTFQLYADYANDPLVYEESSGDADSELVSLVSDQLTLHTIASLGLYDRALLFLGMPIQLVMVGTELGQQPAGTGFGPGDLMLGGRLAVYQSEQTHVAIQLTVTAPTGEAGDRGRPALAGDTGATFAPAATADVLVGPLTMLFDVGMHFRPDEAFSGTRIRNGLTFGVGLSLPIAHPLLRAILEAEGESPLDDFGERKSSQLQALLGVRLQAPLGLSFGLAGGTGLLRGYGSPDVRGVLTVAYAIALAPREEMKSTEPEPEPEPTPVEPEPEPAPVMAPRDTAAEPLAAEAIADRDKDGVIDNDDRCPILPGSSQESGCPRTIRYDAATGAIELLQAVRFDDGKRLNRRAEEVITEVAAALEANPKLRIRVEAHLSRRSRGDAQEAMKLSRDRAEAVALRLIEMGVSSSRLSAFGCGANRPLVPDRGSQRFKNERIELHVTDPLPPSGMRSTLGCTEASLPADRAPKALEENGTARPALPAPAASPTPTPTPAPKPATAPAPAPKPAPQAATAPAPKPAPQAATAPAPAPKPAPQAKPAPAAKPPLAAAAGITAAAVLAGLASEPKGDSDHDGVENAKDECPVAPGPRSGAPSGCPAGHRVDLAQGKLELLKPIKFDDGASTPSAKNDAQLDELAATLQANPKMKVLIEAHTGEEDSPDASTALTRKRAAAVRRALATRGVAPGRMSAYGCGQNRPIAPNNVPWGRKKNERIELHVLDPAPTSGLQSTEGCVASE